MPDRSLIASYTEYRKRAAQPAPASPHGPADQRSARFACCTARFGKSLERYPMRLTPRQCWATSRPRAQTQIPAQKAGLLIFSSYSRELLPNFGDGPRVQAAAVWDFEDVGFAATSIPSVNLTP